MYEGSIKKIIEDKGFGFIRCSNFERDVFFHTSGLTSGLEFGPALEELRVSFNTIQTERGPRAIEVREVN